MRQNNIQKIQLGADMEFVTNFTQNDLPSNLTDKQKRPQLSATVPEQYGSTFDI